VTGETLAGLPENLQSHALYVERVVTVATSFRRMNAAIGALFLLWYAKSSVATLVATIFPLAYFLDAAGWIVMLWLCISLLALVQIYRLARALNGFFPIGYILGALLPIWNLFVVLRLSSRARQVFDRHRMRRNLLGPTAADIRGFRAVQLARREPPHALVRF
jgi:hypothetical protein